ncbi:hypothetical protein G9X67_00610 [Rhizobium sp. WYCCWR 11152]|uniref:hypothetical protein n=1 Tax=Rhizobium sp. WYCCWR 11152 TaxID=2692316 RepID=UPI0014916CD3|nr:hypothetical protein [Rhizobium sp. WYCCWR 11152]NNU63795.1 hypothetical protein [Rhizobium sp. WYCCWR 11152]
MENLPVELIAAHDGEILPPERGDDRDEMSTCLCCGRPRSFLDEDGCGICEECLAP